jgi:hypothetical protein
MNFKKLVLGHMTDNMERFLGSGFSAVTASRNFQFEPLILYHIDMIKNYVLFIKIIPAADFKSDIVI